MLLTSVSGAAACGPNALALPGTAACVELGGTVRAEAAGRTGRMSITAPIAPASPNARAKVSLGARVDVDARVPTAYGLLRAYLGVATGGFRQR